MVKLDVNLLRYLSGDDFRVLTAVEMGMKNHELVPQSTVAAIGQIPHGGVSKALMELSRHKLLYYERGKRYDGYKLNYLGYDYLALNVLRQRNHVCQVGNQIGVGKESDVFIVANEEGKRYALKVHRLGRTCFRTVNSKRDYQKAGRKVHSWIYLSRLAATREFAFLKALHERGFPTPIPVDWNRHCIVMELIEGTLLNHLQPDDLEDIGQLYDSLMELLLRLANDFGVVHGDFNEFNIMVRHSDNQPVLIDFPQMVPVDHKYAQSYFERDVNCLELFFRKRFNYVADRLPSWAEDVHLDRDREVLAAQIDATLEGVEDLQLAREGSEADEEFHDAVERLDIKESPNSDVQLPIAINISEAKNSGDESDGLDDLRTEFSAVSGATSRSTFAPQDVRHRIKREQVRHERHRQLKAATKDIKGESNAVRRKRHEDRLIIREDMKTHKLDPFA